MPTRWVLRVECFHPRWIFSSKKKYLNLCQRPGGYCTRLMPRQAFHLLLSYSLEVIFLEISWV